MQIETPSNAPRSITEPALRNDPQCLAGSFNQAEITALKEQLTAAESARREAVVTCAKLCAAYGLEIGGEFYITCSKACAQAIRAAFPDDFTEPKEYPS